MFDFPRLVIFGIAAACVSVSILVVRRHPAPTDVTDPPFADQRYETKCPVDPNCEAEGLTCDQILAGATSPDTRPLLLPKSPMPRTFCWSVETAPAYAARFAGSYAIHQFFVLMFERAADFGFVRMSFMGKDDIVDRVELVSLLKDETPFVYVENLIASHRVEQAEHRPLDTFERLGLDALRHGDELVWTPVAPRRLFGAIRANAICRECHPLTKEGDLLGAFTYYLNVPVNRLGQDTHAKQPPN